MSSAQYDLIVLGSGPAGEKGAAKATGSYPFRPAGFPFHDPRVHDSDTILTLHEIPAALIVVGGGVIGCEYACMFAALGVKLTLIEKRPRLLKAKKIDYVVGRASYAG